MLVWCRSGSEGKLSEKAHSGMLVQARIGLEDKLGKKTLSVKLV